MAEASCRPVSGSCTCVPPRQPEIGCVSVQASAQARHARTVPDVCCKLLQTAEQFNRQRWGLVALLWGPTVVVQCRLLQLARRPTRAR